jgi:hypothetical protein
LSNAILRQTNDGKILFFCPGCKGVHGINVAEGKRPCWKWNNSMEKPTFKPSILVSYGDNTEQAWSCTARRTAVNRVCHSFITDGKIKFCNDSTHDLAGKTVDLPEFETNFQKWADDDCS